MTKPSEAGVFDASLLPLVNPNEPGMGVTVPVILALSTTQGDIDQKREEITARIGKLAVRSSFWGKIGKIPGEAI